MRAPNNLPSIPVVSTPAANQAPLLTVNQAGAFENAAVRISPEELQTLGGQLGLNSAITLPNNGPRQRAREILRPRRAATEHQKATTTVPNRGALNSSPRTSAPASYHQTYSGLSFDNDNTNRQRRAIAEPYNSTMNTTPDLMPTSVENEDLFSPESLEDTVNIDSNPAANNSATALPTTVQTRIPEGANLTQTQVTNLTQTPETESTTEGAKNCSEPAVIHFDSFRAAAAGYEQGQTRFEILVRARDHYYLSRILTAILQPDSQTGSDTDLTYNGNLLWSAKDESSASAIASVDSQGFLRSLGVAATYPCISDISVETLHTLEGRQQIQEMAEERAEILKQHNFIHAGEQSEQVCISREYTYESGAQRGDIVCRERAVFTERELTAQEKVFYEDRCVDMAFIIGDGIDASRPVSSRVKETISLDGPPTQNAKTEDVSSAIYTEGAQPLNATQSSPENNRATLLTQVMARYCPTTQYVDVRATQPIAGDEARGIPTTTALSSTRLLQALQEVLNMLRHKETTHVDNGGFEVEIVIYDVDETPNYHPSIKALRSVVRLLGERGVNVFAYAASAGSFLSKIPGVRVTSNIAEIVARTSQRGAQNYFTAKITLQVACIAFGVLLIQYIRKRKSNNAGMCEGSIEEKNTSVLNNRRRRGQIRLEMARTNDPESESRLLEVTSADSFQPQDPNPEDAAPENNRQQRKEGTPKFN